jgi:ferritin-like metal-binding protein YciE
MSTAEQKVVQYLHEAHASEVALVNVLTEQIAMAPRGSLRSGLETHLRETRDHARRVQERIGQLDAGHNPLQVVSGLAQTMVEQALALAKAPLDLMRGSGGEEKVLKNAKDACATEALEIATYTALETLARTVGDEATAKLAVSIREDEQKMLDRLLGEIPKLTEAVVRADVEGVKSYDVTKTGAADAARVAGQATAETTKQAAETTKQAARTTGKAAAQTTKQAARTTGKAAAQTTKATRTAGKAGAQTTKQAARTTGKAAAQTTKQAARTADTATRNTARQARQAPGVARAEGQVKGAVADASDLPLPRYDELKAEEIVPRLPELSQIDLAKVDSYERRTHDRTTVTERISALRGDEPWPGYDEQSAADIQSALHSADDDRAQQVRSYERAHKNRASVLKAAERELASA